MSAGDLVSGEIKHTATPWIADEFGKIWSADGSVCVADCKPVDFMGQRQSDKPKTRIGNAKFIVRACNAHDDLVKALEGVIRVADRATDEFDAARAALAKAGANN